MNFKVVGTLTHSKFKRQNHYQDKGIQTKMLEHRKKSSVGALNFFGRSTTTQQCLASSLSYWPSLQSLTFKWHWRVLLQIMSMFHLGQLVIQKSARHTTRDDTWLKDHLLGMLRDNLRCVIHLQMSSTVATSSPVLLTFLC